MIISFGSSDTEKVWNGERVKRLTMLMTQLIKIIQPDI